MNWTRTVILTMLALEPGGTMADPAILAAKMPGSSATRVAGLTGARQGSAAPETSAALELLAWQRRNASQLATVERAWAALLRRMGGFRPGEFGRQCEGLATSLARLDEAILLPAPDLLVDLYVRRMAKHLHAAATGCRAKQLFNVVYRLEEARSALGEIRWLVAQRTRAVDSPP